MTAGISFPIRRANEQDDVSTISLPADVAIERKLSTRGQGHTAGDGHSDEVVQSKVTRMIEARRQVIAQARVSAVRHEQLIVYESLVSSD